MSKRPFISSALCGRPTVPYSNAGTVHSSINWYKLVFSSDITSVNLLLLFWFLWYLYFCIFLSTWFASFNQLTTISKRPKDSRLCVNCSFLCTVFFWRPLHPLLKVRVSFPYLLPSIMDLYFLLICSLITCINSLSYPLLSSTY